MGLQDFFIDVKNILFGRVDFDNGEDFKEEIQSAIKAGVITKAEAALLIQSVNNVKANATDLEKRQLSTISLEDGSVVSVEEYENKKKELERKKREKEAQQRASIENVKNQNIQTQVKTKKVVNNSNKLNIDRNKIVKAIESDEKAEKIAEQKLNKAERDGKN